MNNSLRRILATRCVSEGFYGKSLAYASGYDRLVLSSNLDMGAYIDAIHLHRNF